MYRRASKAQRAYIEQLADMTSTALPWGYEGYSMEKAAELIKRLRRAADKQEAKAEEAKQPRLFDV